MLITNGGNDDRVTVGTERRGVLHEHHQRVGSLAAHFSDVVGVVLSNSENGWRRRAHGTKATGQPAVQSALAVHGAFFALLVLCSALAFTLRFTRAVGLHIGRLREQILRLRPA